MTDARSNPVPRPARSRWTSFVGSLARRRAERGLEEEGNPKHRIRVEHNKHTLLVHVSDEDARGWTTVAIDRHKRVGYCPACSSAACGLRRLRAAVSIKT